MLNLLECFFCLPAPLCWLLLSFNTSSCAVYLVYKVQLPLIEISRNLFLCIVVPMELQMFGIASQKNSREPTESVIIIMLCLKAIRKKKDISLNVVVKNCSSGAPSLTCLPSGTKAVMCTCAH